MPGVSALRLLVFGWIRVKNKLRISIPFWLSKPFDLPVSLNTHLLILFFIGVTVYATSRISNRFPRFQAANFDEMMDERQLNGSVTKEVEVESESSCRLECVNEERCKSYNFDD